MPYASVNSCRLYYEVEGKGPPLVLVAGYNCDLGFWAGVREELARHFQLILFDNRGFGKSECPHKSFTLEEMGEDVLHLIEKLGLKRPHILGHSMGGAIAQAIAYQHPAKIGRTIFAQTLSKFRPAPRAALLSQLHLYQDKVSLRRIAEVTLPWLFSESLLEKDDFCQTFIQFQEQNPPRVDGLSLQLEALFQFDSRPWCSKITTHPLILSSDEDRFCPLQDAEWMAAKIPHAKLHIFQGVGHVALIERPTEFCQIVTHFLQNT